MTELDRLYLDHVATLEAAYARAFDGQQNGGFDGVAIHSGNLVPRSEFDDQFWPLRPVPHWQHWLPLVEPDAVLLVEPGRKPRLVRRNASSFWESPAPPESDAFLQASRSSRTARAPSCRAFSRRAQARASGPS